MKRGISLLLCLLLAVGMVCSATGCGEEDPPRKEVSEQEDKAKEVEEVRNTCRVYYESHFVKDTDIALCADVTGDQIPELIVVRFDRQEDCIAGEVFTCVDGKMKKIHSKSGGFDHVHSFFSWYLAPNGKNSFYLVEETHGMWQGSGVITARMYQLDKNGKEKEIQYKELSSSDESVTVENSSPMGHEITQEAWDAYVKDVQKMVKGGYIIYSNASNCDLLRVLSHPDKSFYLTDLRELASPTFENKENDTTSEAESAVTPASSKKPTSPVDRPHVDTVDAAFWRDAEPAIKAWKQYLFTGVSCDLEEIGYHDKDSLNPAGIVSSTIQGEKQEAWEMVQMIYSKVYKSSCCESYEEIDAHNAMYFTDNILKGLSSADSDYHYIFETDGEVYVYMGLTKGNVNPCIHTTAPTFDFSNPSRPKVRVYSFYEYGRMGYYDFEFVKEDGRYKIDSVDSDNVNWTFFAQLLQDLSQYETVEADLCDFMTLSDSYDDPVWFAVPIESDNADVALVNLTTGEVCEAIDDSRYSTKELSDYTFVGESFYVPISW